VLSTPPGLADVPTLAATAPRPVSLLPLAQLGLDASRLVPRPDLLGQLLPASAEPVRQLGVAQATTALMRHV
jgi:hypothetical protein